MNREQETAMYDQPDPHDGHGFCDPRLGCVLGESTDEREALARVQWTDPLNVITWDELTEKAGRDEGDYREIRDYALAAAGRGIAAGFIRHAQGGPSDAEVRAGALAMYGLAPHLSMSGARDLARVALRAASAVRGGEQ